MTTILLNLSQLPDDVAAAHVLEMQGGIPHDKELAATIKNSLCLEHLRLAEAFAAGLRAGHRGASRSAQPRVDEEKLAEVIRPRVKKVALSGVEDSSDLDAQVSVIARALRELIEKKMLEG